MRTILKLLIWSTMLVMLCNIYYDSRIKPQEDAALQKLHEWEDLPTPDVKVEVPANIFIKKDTSRYKGNWVDIN